MSSAEIDRLLDEAQRLPDESPTKLALFEQAVRACDAIGDVHRGWSLRMTLTSLIYYTGDWDRMFAHFAWLLGHAKDVPGRESGHDLLWKYKWIANNAVKFPEVSIANVEGMLDDMEARFRAAGSTCRAVHQHRLYLALELGDHDAARRLLERWWHAPRDGLSDCYACELNARGWAFEQLGDDERAVGEWLAAIKGYPCHYVPDVCRGYLLSHLFRRGERRSAAAQHRLGYAAVRSKASSSCAHARHMAYEATRGRADEVVAMLDRHLGEGVADPTPDDRLDFLTQLVYVLDRLGELGRDRLPLRLPERVELPREEQVETAALRAWADVEARRIVDRFAQRHRSDQRLREHEGYRARFWGD